MATAQATRPEARQSLASREPEYLTEPLANDLLDLLCEAGTEINNLAGDGNVVAARLRQMRARIRHAKLADRRAGA